MKAVVLCCLAALACDLERMKEQEKARAFRASPYLPGGRVLQEPVPGTVARDAPRRDAPPPKVTLALVEQGRARFGVFCAPCHGHAGDGVSVVARYMALRKPPSLVAKPIVDYPRARIVRAITDGFGLMRSYAAELEPDERWAVAAYVEALQVSHGVRLDELPREVAAEAKATLEGRR